MPLTVLIAGAGIAGLSCAIALGRGGHTVHLFEKSKFSNEVGAAFHFGPHAHRVLRKWGFDTQSINPSVCLSWRSLKSDGELIETKFELRSKQKLLGVIDDEIMIHRVDTHAALREYALLAPNVTLHLSSGLKSVDPSAASIVLEDGSIYTGDVVVGADGVHSKSVQFLTESDCGPFTFGVNMYRFMVPYATARSIPSVKQFLDRIDYATTHNTIFGGDDPSRRSTLVLYPCRGGSLINLATFQFASEEKVQLGTAYTNPGTVDEVSYLFQHWPQYIRELTSLAEDVKHWACVTGKPRETFVNGRLVCIGDAAHPTLPTHGAGAGMAVEDAGVLGVLLNCSVSKEEVPGRLKLYNDLRYERATTVKCASEMIVSDDPKRNENLLRQYVPNGNIPADMEEYLWPVDVVEDAKRALREIGE